MPRRQAPEASWTRGHHLAFYVNPRFVVERHARRDETSLTGGRVPSGQNAVDQGVGTGAITVGGVRDNSVAARGGEIEALVEEIPAPQSGSHEVPGDPEETCARLRVHPVGAVEELVEQRAEPGIIELPAGRRGEQVVAADQRDDLRDARKPLGE